jgi:DNA repair exonuclease SbcCD nuclease subunit
MTKIALITDQHAGVRNDSPVFIDYLDKSFRWFFDVVDQQNIKHVIHLGDIVDRRKYISYATSYSLRNSFLLPLEQREIETHIIAGNHDITYKNTSYINALDELITDRYKNIHTYSKPHNIEIDGVDILLLPWINESNKDISEKAVRDTKAQIVMSHLELLGFEMFRGTVSTHGDDRKLYDKFDLVFSGHFHHKSSIGNVHYLGAFAEFTWSDYNDPRGFHIFDTTTREFEFHRNPYQIFKLLGYDDVKDKEIIKTITESDYSEYTNTYVKVVCVNKSNPYAFDMMLDKLYKESPADITIVEDMSLFSETSETTEIDEAESTENILDKYVQGLTLPVSNDKMKSYLKEIYHEALTIEHV